MALHAASLPRSAVEASGGAEGGRLGVENDRLRFQERKQAFPPPFATDAGLLEAAKRNAEIGAERIVSDRPRTQSPCGCIGTLGVMGEDRSVEAKNSVVGDLDCLCLIVGRNDRQDRPEDLLARDGGMVVDVAEHRRLYVKAAWQIGRTATAKRQRGALFLTLGNVALDAIALAPHGQGPHLAGPVERIADLDLGKLRTQRLDHRVMALAGDHDAGERGADLARQEGRKAGDASRGRLDIVVIQDHRRRFATEFQGAARNPLATE